MITAKVELKVPNPKRVYEALKPDVSGTERFEVKLEPKKNTLNLSVVAKDISAMKAALNSYLRLLSLIRELDK